MNTDRNVRGALLEAGRREFLAKGYEKASLRSICSDAGVTTGALYFFFKNKEELFVSIVSRTAERLMELVRRQTLAELSGNGDKDTCQHELNLYLCTNRDEVRILLHRADGTPFEGFRDDYAREIAKGFYAFYDRCGGTEEYRDIMKLVVYMRIQGYIRMLDGDYDMDKMMKFSALMEVYGDSGFAGMMQQFESIAKGSVD